MNQTSCYVCGTVFSTTFLVGANMCNICKQTRMLEDQQLKNRLDAIGNRPQPEVRYVYVDSSANDFSGPSVPITPLPETPIKDFLHKILLSSIVLFPFICIGIILMLKTLPANIFVLGVGICIAWYYYRELAFILEEWLCGLER